MMELLGLLGKKYYFGKGKNHSWGRIFDSLAKKKKPFQHQELDLERALYLKENLRNSRSKYNVHRKLFGHLVKIPSRKRLEKYRYDSEIYNLFASHKHFQY